MSDPKAIWLE